MPAELIGHRCLMLFPLTYKDYLAPLEASIALSPTNLATDRIKAMDAFTSG
jgi:hypothetical protein